MMALVSSDELAKDVTGAEALLERHQVRGVNRGNGMGRRWAQLGKRVVSEMGR